MGILDWLNRNASGLGFLWRVAGALRGLVFGKRAEGGTRTRVRVRSSPGATAAGRDLGIQRNKQTETDAVVDVRDSEGAEAAGRDLKR